MKGIMTTISFLVIGMMTAYSIGFGWEREDNSHIYDEELAGLTGKYQLILSHVVAENTPKGRAAAMFAELVREKTNGWVEVQVFPNGVLYDAQEEFAALQRQDVHVIAPALSEITVHDRQWAVMDLPFLFADEKALAEAYKGELGKLLFESIDQYGYKGIGYWENGFKQLTNNIRPLRLPEDVAGLSMRVMPSETLLETYRQLDASPHVYGFNDVYDVLSEGIVDGTENTLSNIYSKGFHRQQEYLTISNHNYLGYAVIMNQDVWSSLPVEYQTSIEEAMDKTVNWLSTHAKELNQGMLRQIEATGEIEIHTLTEEERQIWIEALQPLYERYELIVDTEIMEEVYRIQQEGISKGDF